MGGFSGVLPFGGVVSRVSAAAVSLALVAFFVPDLSARAQMMAVPDSISVSETGGAIQSFPIAVPPGTAGMVPSLSLTYNSQGNNGIVGIGYMLNGLASIGRCPRIFATDGVRGGVNFDANDRFCLDGQRLIAVSGAYGADGTEYRTEIESFSKVISRGAAGTGPAWFEVRTKSGQVMEFGNSADSRILATGKPSARSWAVNKVSDTAGNYMTVSYVSDAANGQAYPSRIDYTGNSGAGLAPYNSLRFVYSTDRPDVTTAYLAGSLMRTTVLVSNIQTYAGESLVSDYRLTYNSVPATGRKRLRTVTMCEGGGACLPTTTIGWSSGGNLSGGFVKTTIPASDGIPSNYNIYAEGDFNGDGLPDLYLAESKTDGRAYGGESSQSDQVWLSKGNGTFDKLIVQGGDKIVVNNRVFTSGDFNGDGLADLYLADSQADGRAFGTTQQQSDKVWLSNGNGTFTKLDFQGTDKIPANNRVYAGGDFNGDGLTDFYLADSKSDGRAFGGESNQVDQVWLSRGNGTFEKLIFQGGDRIAVNNRVFTSGDFNGDGLTDHYLADSRADGRAFGTTQQQPDQIWLSNGNGAFTKLSFQGTDKIALDNRVFAAGDYNGDGLSDFYLQLSQSDGRAAGGQSPQLWRSPGPVPDILSSVADGLGALTSITYSPMTDGSVYTKDAGATAASYPVIDVISPMQVTSRIEQTDGIGGMRASTYRYAGAKADATGRGFLGFREMTARDEQTGIEQHSTYEQLYPFTLLKKSDRRLRNGALLSSVVNSYSAANLGGTRQQVTLTQTMTAGADLDGVVLPSAATAYQYDSFGNATQITVANSDGFSKVTTNSYTNDTANWLLGRLTAATVTSQAPAVGQGPWLPDPNPDPFDFIDLTDVPMGAVRETSAIVNGFDGVIAASVSGGGSEIRKNDSGAWGATLSLVAGDKLAIRMTAGYGVKTATVQAGALNVDWQITSISCAATPVAGGCLYNQPGAFTYNVPQGVTNIRVTVVGAGGGLGTRDHSNWHAYGGAGGGATIKTMPVTPGQFFALNVGRGGSSQPSWCNRCSGGSGESSAFAGLSATGGQGGHINGIGVVSSGGSGSGGDQNCTGGSGTVIRNGRVSTGEAGGCNGGAGGSSGNGGPIGGSGGAASLIGGAGGSGVCGAGSGAWGVAGANGCVLVEWL